MKFWGFTFTCAVYLINRLPTPVLQDSLHFLFFMVSHRHMITSEFLDVVVFRNCDLLTNISWSFDFSPARLLSVVFIIKPINVLRQMER